MYATARNLETLADLEVLGCHTLALDVTSEDSMTAAVKAVEAEHGRVGTLINNAGFGDMGTFETSDPAKIESMLAVNIAALTRLTRWALPGMLARQAGWICNVGSTAGLIPLPTFAVYAASKAYVNSFSEALRIELHGSGVRVIALCPGPVETEFGQVASRENSRRKFAPPSFLCVSKTKVVRETLTALARGRGRLIPGLMVRFPMLLAESTPRWILRLVFNLTSGDYRKERLNPKKT